MCKLVVLKMISQCWICAEVKGCKLRGLFSVNSVPSFCNTNPYFVDSGFIGLKWQHFMCTNCGEGGIQDT